jgi:hypothetical protein
MTLTAVSFLLTSPSTRTRSGKGFRSFDLLIVREVPNDTPAAFEQRLCDAQADTARRARDDGDGLLGCLHSDSISPGEPPRMILGLPVAWNEKLR